MKWVVLTLLLIFLGKMAFAETAIEKKVNSHLSNTHSKIEIERQKREADLIKENRDIQVDPMAKPVTPKIYRERSNYNPDVSQKDPEVVQDHFDQQTETDAAYQAQRDVQMQQEQQKREALERQQYIDEFKRRAKESGVEVDVDPKTLKARPR